MEKTNVIDLNLIRKTQVQPSNDLETAIKDDLTSAIKLLIQRLREAKPLQQTG